MAKKIITIGNHKGGVGKTTIAAHLGHALAIRGYNVLLVDMDPQGNISSQFGIKNPPSGVFKILGQELPVAQAIVSSGRDHLWIIPSDKKTANVPAIMTANNSPLTMLRDILRPLLKDRTVNGKNVRGLDYIIIDTAPSVSDLQGQAFMAADLLLPVTLCQRFSLEGVGNFLNVAMGLRKSHGWDGAMLGILPNMFETVTVNTRETYAELKSLYGEDQVLDYISESTALAASSAYGLTVFEFPARPGVVERPRNELNALADHVVRVTKTR